MKAFRTISSIVLALLVLVSSTSFIVGMHLCMGEVQNVALFSKADVCEQEQQMPPCHRHMKAPCCDDETVVHKADDFKASVAQFDIATPFVTDLAQSLVLIAEIIPSVPAAQTKYYNYDPPLRSSDIIVDIQVFLI